MKILVIGDPHFMKHNAIETSQLSAEVERICGEHNPDYIVVLGDCLDSFEKIDLLTMNRCVDFLARCRELCRHLFVLVGNHDRRNQLEFLTSQSSLRPLREWDRTTLADTVQDFDDGEIKILLVPYVPPGRFFEALGHRSIYDYDMVFSHQEYHGIKLDSGPISESSDRYPSDAPICFNGHIHTFGEVAPNLFNVGTPYHKDFGDLTDKALMLVTFESKKTSFERLRIAVRSKKVIVIPESSLDSFEIHDNHYYKVIVEGDPTTIVHHHAYKALHRAHNVMDSIRDTRANVPSDIETKVREVCTVPFIEQVFSKITDKRLRKVLSQIISE
jgi:DNA repair exonuclease SbcCD nuclease subunit